MIRVCKVDWVALVVLMTMGCNPPNVAPPPLQPMTTGEAFAGDKCTALRPPTEPNLMAWDPGSRANLAALRKQGVIAVHYEAHGCDVSLEVLSNCVAPGSYRYEPYWESDHKLSHNAGELHGNLPLGAASFESKLEGNRVLRTDYMLVGIAQIPIGTMYPPGSLRGSDCARATHVVSRIFLGGFAMAAGEARTLEASASLFATLGASTKASVEQFQPAGDPKSCERARDTQSEQPGCSVPLRLTLLPMAQGRGCLEPNECSTRCDSGDTLACVDLGNMAVSGNGMARNPQSAMSAFKKACDLGYQLGCGWLGQMYYFGDGVPVNFPLAASLSAQACAGGNWPSCTIMGNIYERGLGLPVDLQRALNYFVTACDGNDKDACTHVQPLLARACESKDANACVSLGKMYFQGQGIPQDQALGVAQFQRACELRSSAACVEVATMYRKGLGVPKDPQKAIALYKSICDDGEAMGCSALGMMYMSGDVVRKDVGQALTLFERGCTLGDANGCACLGGLYEDGVGVEADVKHALDLYQGACDQGSGIGCAGLGGLYEEGTGVKQDTARAMSLYQRACSAGFDDACPAAARLANGQ